MLPAERQRKIVELVTREDGCSVEDLARELGYSKATIRRDLRDLEEDGRIKRSHGGAVPVTSVASEPTFGHAQVQHLEGKQRIAERAVEELDERQVVFFDSGTTTMQVATALPEEGSLVAATNSPLIAAELSRRDAKVKVTGGTLAPSSMSLVGPTAEEFMERMYFDQVFLGTPAVHAQAGLTAGEEDDAQMKALMVEKSDRVVLVADERKVGRQELVNFAALDDVDVFITDARLDDDQRAAFEDAGVDVVTVES